MSAAELAGRLALRRSGRSFTGTCPACGTARAFSVRDLKGRAVARCFYGCSRDLVSETLARVAGGEWQVPDRTPDGADAAASRARATAAALRTWNGAATASGTPADAYLIRRGLPGLAASPALRFRGDCSHPEGGRYPALVALVVDSSGKAIAVHRTYVTTAGRKATAEPPRASLGQVWGGAIRLDPEAPEIVIGEGIESSGSAGRLLSLPAWSAVNAGNLGGGVVLPPCVRAVVIAADADAAGRNAAEAAAERWQAEGRRVRIACPDVSGQDFNDLLGQQSGGFDAA